MTLSEDNDHAVTAVGTSSAAAHLATRRLGTASAVGVVILSAAYVVPSLWRLWRADLGVFTERSGPADRGEGASVR